MLLPWQDSLKFAYYNCSAHKPVIDGMDTLHINPTDAQARSGQDLSHFGIKPPIILTLLATPPNLGGGSFLLTVLS